MLNTVIGRSKVAKTRRRERTVAANHTGELVTRPPWAKGQCMISAREALANLTECLVGGVILDRVVSSALRFFVLFIS